jgi:hypothetical protein
MENARRELILFRTTELPISAFLCFFLQFTSLTHTYTGPSTPETTDGGYASTKAMGKDEKENIDGATATRDYDPSERNRPGLDARDQ